VPERISQEAAVPLQDGAAPELPLPALCAGGVAAAPFAAWLEFHAAQRATGGGAGAGGGGGGAGREAARGLSQDIFWPPPAPGSARSAAAAERMGAGAGAGVAEALGALAEAAETEAGRLRALGPLAARGAAEPWEADVDRDTLIVLEASAAQSARWVCVRAAPQGLSAGRAGVAAGAAGAVRGGRARATAAGADRAAHPAARAGAVLSTLRAVAVWAV
jgi:hypothetical protein